MIVARLISIAALLVLGAQMPASAEESGQAAKQAAAQAYVEMVAYDFMVRPTAVMVADEVMAALSQSMPGLPTDRVEAVGRDLAAALEADLGPTVERIMLRAAIANFTGEELALMVDIYENHFVGPVRDKYADFMIETNRDVASHLQDVMPRAVRAAVSGLQAGGNM